MRPTYRVSGLVVLVLMVGAAAASRHIRAPTITPTSHDFGDNVVGVGGNWFAFTVVVPPGGGLKRCFVF